MVPNVLCVLMGSTSKIPNANTVELTVGPVMSMKNVQTLIPMRHLALKDNSEILSICASIALMTANIVEKCILVYNAKMGIIKTH